MRVLVVGPTGPAASDGAWPGGTDVVPAVDEPAAGAPGAPRADPGEALTIGAGTSPHPRDVAAWWAGAGGGTTAVPVGLARSGPAFLDALGGSAPELLAAVVAGDGGAEVPVVVRRDPRTATVYADASQVPAVADPAEDVTPGAGTRSSVPRSSAALGHLLALCADAARTPDGRPGRVVLATGGARSHDGGWGLLRTLAGRTAPGAGAAAADVLAGARSTLRGTSLVAAVASSTPLLGLHGASAALAARGVDGAVAQDLERRLGAVAHDVAEAVGTLDRDGRGALVGRDLLAGTSPRRLAALAGTGSGGGAGFALAALGARLVPAVRVVADAVGLDARLAAADLVVVVADELGAHELGDDAPTRDVARRAAEHALPVVVVARTVVAGRREQAAAGLSGVHAWGEGDARALVERVARTWSRV